MGKSKKNEEKKKSEEELKKEENNQKAKNVVYTKKSQPNCWKTYGYKISIGLCVIISAFILLGNLNKQSVNTVKTKVNDQIYLKVLKQSKSFETDYVQFFGNMTLAQAKPIFNNVFYPQNKQLYKCMPSQMGDMLQEQYNFRQEHSQCANQIKNQGNCSSAYAVTVAGVVSDRLCQNTKKNRPLSAMPMIACDLKKINTQCTGGYISRALDYSKVNGYFQQECFPYDINNVNATCNQTLKNCPSEKIHKIDQYCVAQDQQNIKRQIKTKGPLLAIIPIYRDFLVYKGGAYKATAGTPRYQGQQAVKLIGWKTIDQKPVWIIQNSLGEQWGDKGLGYIQIGQDEFFLEQFTLAPQMNQQAKSEEQEHQEIKKQVQSQTQQQYQFEQN